MKLEVIEWEAEFAKKLGLVDTEGATKEEDFEFAPFWVW